MDSLPENKNKDTGWGLRCIGGMSLKCCFFLCLETRRLPFPNPYILGELSVSLILNPGS